jgi:hypothetical protein
MTISRMLSRRLARTQKATGAAAVTTVSRLGRKLSNQKYWRHLGEDWTTNEDRDGGWPFLSLFRSPRGERTALMTAEEHAALAALPDPAILYRGIAFFPGNPLKYARGLSWTDDLDIAAYFAHPYQWAPAGAVLVAVVPRWRFLAYFKRRGENEVVIDPRRIRYRVHLMSTQEAQERADAATQRLEDHVDEYLRKKSLKAGVPAAGFRTRLDGAFHLINECADPAGQHDASRN